MSPSTPEAAAVEASSFFADDRLAMAELALAQGAAVSGGEHDG